MINRLINCSLYLFYQTLLEYSTAFEEQDWCWLGQSNCNNLNTTFQLEEKWYFNQSVLEIYLKLCV